MGEQGASRQECHEDIRIVSHQAAAVIKDLIERIRNTAYFKPIHDNLDSGLDPSLYVSHSATIVERSCDDVVSNELEKYRDYLAKAEAAELSI